MPKVVKKTLIPDDDAMHHVQLNELKTVHGKWARQVRADVRVLNGDYKGVQFRNWFSFGKEDEEEVIFYDSPLWQLLELVIPDLEEVLENQTDAEFEKTLKKALKDLDGIELLARVEHRYGSKEDREEKRNPKGNTLGRGFGLYVDLEAATNNELDDLDMSKEAS